MEVLERALTVEVWNCRKLISLCYKASRFTAKTFIVLSDDVIRHRLMSSPYVGRCPAHLISFSAFKSSGLEQPSGASSREAGNCETLVVLPQWA